MYCMEYQSNLRQIECPWLGKGKYSGRKILFERRAHESSSLIPMTRVDTRFWISFPIVKAREMCVRRDGILILCSSIKVACT